MRFGGETLTLISSESIRPSGGAPSAASVSAREVLVVSPEMYRHFFWPAWLLDVFRDLEALESLDEDWDGEGAPPIDSRALHSIAWAVQVLADYAQQPPQITPTPEGGSSAEWRGGGYSFVLTAEPEGSVRYYYADRLRRFEYGGATDRGNDLADEIKKWLWTASATR
jgi:hypothetical protein